MNDFFRISSISQLHDMIGYEKPKHPLITLIEPGKIEMEIPEIKQKIVSDLYSISLKNGNECKIKYGRRNYDFQEGSLMFLAPNQTVEPISPSDDIDKSGWILLFHPDLIKGSTLANRMHEYSFFSYDSHEALHMSDHERQIINGVAYTIKHEYSQNIDAYSNELIISNLELMLNYSKRFYGRQFITRKNVNHDVLIKLENYLRNYFESDNLEINGIPSVKDVAKEMGYSANYLSDLLKKETGKNTKEHLDLYLIEKAKELLLGTVDPVSTIAYSLGFEYPQHFSKFFKNKTGLSPSDYRS